MCILSGLISAAIADSSLVIKNAERSIDVTSQLVKITHRLTLSNTGKSAVSSFDFTIDAKSQEHLSYLKAQVCDDSLFNQFERILTLFVLSCSSQTAKSLLKDSKHPFPPTRMV